jgi:hypothetical protein
VKRWNENIWEVALPGAISTAITYSLDFEQWEAASEAGLDLFRWEQSLEDGGYPIWFKVKAIAWYRLHKMVRQHGEAAVAQAVKRK